MDLPHSACLTILKSQSAFLLRICHPCREKEPSLTNLVEINQTETGLGLPWHLMPVIFKSVRFAGQLGFGVLGFEVFGR